MPFRVLQHFQEVGAGLSSIRSGIYPYPAPPH